VKIDYQALHHNPLWRALWEQSEIKEKIDAIEAQLLRGQHTDPHTLGRLRGQLDAYRGLPQLVAALADVQAKQVHEAEERLDREKKRGPMWGLLRQMK
jgi:hypothetical protein